VEEHVKDTKNITPRALVPRTLVTFVAAAGFALAGCSENVQPAAPPAPPEVPSVEPPPAAQDWVRSMCQVQDPIFTAPPPVDLSDPAATRQAYSTYFADAQTAADQALDRLQSLGVPPVENGQEVFNDLRDQLTDLRADLADARSQLDQADPNDLAAVGNSVVAAGNVVGALGNKGQVLAIFETSPQLDAAAEQVPECEDLEASNQPTGSAPTS